MMGARAGNRFRAILLAAIMVLSIVSMTVAVMPGAADDAAIVAERSLAEDTIAPGDEIEVELEIELLEGGSNLTLIDEVEPDVLDEGSDITDIDTPHFPEVMPVGVQGAAVIWGEEDWEAGDSISISYTLNTSEDMDHGETITFSSESEFDNERFDIGGPDTVEVVDPDLDPAEYQLSDLDPADTTVTEGDDPIDLSVTIENIGEEVGEQDIELEIANETEDVVHEDTVEELSLDADASETVTFEAVPAGDFEVGEYDVTVVSANDSIVGMLTVTEVPPEPAPAEYQLSNLDPADVTVTDGDDPIDFTVDTENVGDEVGDQDIELEILNETDDVVYEAAVEAVALDAADTDTVTFEAVPVGDFEVGEYDVTVASANDSVAGTITVTEAVPDPEPAEYQVSNLDPADVTVTEGDDPIDFTVDTENVGDEVGDQDIELEIANSSTDEIVIEDTVSDVELAGGAQETVTFEAVDVGDLDAGDYDVTISSDNDSVSGSLTVESDEPFLDDPTPGFTPLVALVAILGAGLLARRA